MEVLKHLTQTTNQSRAVAYSLCFAVVSVRKMHPMYSMRMQRIIILRQSHVCVPSPPPPFKLGWYHAAANLKMTRIIFSSFLVWPFILCLVGDNEGFSKDICRSMVAMLDADHSGKLGIDEFKKLMVDIAKWRTVFKSFDHDGSGKFNTFELRAALEASGYKLSNHVLNALVHRYGSRDGQIAFDDFIMCAVKIKTMIGKCFECPCKISCQGRGIAPIVSPLATQTTQTYSRNHIQNQDHVYTAWLTRWYGTMCINCIVHVVEPGPRTICLIASAFRVQCIISPVYYYD